MKNYQVKKYSSEFYFLWNEFVAKSKNATFLFHRDFMEYHQDRFEDFSLLVFDDSEQLIALLPANRQEDTLFSHQGLTYGGIILQEKTKLSDCIFIAKSIFEFLKTCGCNKMIFKEIPAIYHKMPSDELRYLMFLMRGNLIRRDVLTVLDMSSSFSFSRDRKNGIKRGIKNNLVVREEANFESFWTEILIPNLAEKHQAKPVHSLQEIQYLHSKFPENIRQFNVYQNDTIVAGTTIFESNFVAHSQYISGNSDKNELGSLDFLHDYLISNVFKNKKYFDFGISNENHGKNINEGLLYWKESFGAKSITQDFYELEINNYILLDNVLL
ncbi:GNAT family N-acetyltransferase [Flavobacterium cyclinae]|uniref:GNAT family N-acetyltransferase n=1 Tax=Flavobacterium cyclinae TaxID=2895947 RepID=UPI001E29D498|nr:GNAT family N-acetyltransferase [Flavobacterium cyclinae]UGS20418.1 GNAT family N-acetyltransferase [Flavobacterium cyclinae]